MKGKHTIIEPDGTIIERSYDFRLHSAHEYIKMFKNAGFEIVKLKGSGNKDFTINSNRICIVGKKI
jgi:hypothetical protein